MYSVDLFIIDLTMIFLANVYNVNVTLVPTTNILLRDLVQSILPTLRNIFVIGWRLKRFTLQLQVY